MTLKPIVKWAGGKRSIMDILTKHFPQPHEYNQYHEPFVGGASVVLHLANTGDIHSKHVYISDSMPSLINMYATIQHCPHELIRELQKECYTNTKECFLQARSRFNEIKHTDDITAPNIECAALFVYLNKTCFNGMYRENAKGYYNVPFGSQTNPCICNPESILALSAFLTLDTVHISCRSFETCLDSIHPTDFVYFDPPYFNTFTGYTKHPFGTAEQERLKHMVLALTQQGTKVAVSNSNCEFIRTLYSDIPNVQFIEIPVKRVINSDASQRSVHVSELLILNY